MARRGSNTKPKYNLEETLKMSITTKAQESFTNLRKRLDQLGYQQALGIESLPLVERLFADLLHTTESLRSVKVEHGKKRKEDSGTSDIAIESYRSDNGKLVKENNELHQKLIRQKDEFELTLKDMRCTLRKLEHENADLKFLNNQYVAKIRCLEKDSKQKSECILKLQEKNLHAVVQTPGGRKKSIPFRRQRMEIDSTVPPSESGSCICQQCRCQAEDPYVADMLKVADDSIALLCKQVHDLTNEKQGSEGKVKSLRKQVEARDAEIERMNRLLSGGRPADVVALEARNRSNERLISHLNIQIDFLQQKNEEALAELEHARNRAKSAKVQNLDSDEKNIQLARELKDADTKAYQIQHEKESAIRAADHEVVETKIQLERSRNELENLDLENAALRQEKGEVLSECECLKAQLNSELADRQELECLLDKAQDEKRRLSHRVNKLTSTERELVLEIDRLKHRCSGAATNNKKRNKSPTRAMECYLKSVEEERDFYKCEVDQLNKVLRAKTKASHRSPSPCRGTPRQSSPSRLSRQQRSPGKQKLNTSSTTISSSASPAVAERKAAAHYEGIVRVLEEERDLYKQELEVLKSHYCAPQSYSPSCSNVEVERLQRERDDLQNLLAKFERHVCEIQANVKALTSERDSLSVLYEETKEELGMTRQELLRSPRQSKASLQAQAMLRRLENEREDALTELRRVTTERDTLRERLQIATDTQLSDRARLEQRIEDLQNTVKNVEVEKSSKEDQVKVLENMLDNLESKVKRQATEMVEAHDAISQQKSSANQMRILQEQTEHALKDVQHKLNHKEEELDHRQDDLVQLEKDMITVENDNRCARDEIMHLRHTIAAMDKEKDVLQMCVDEKTELNVQLENDISLKNRLIGKLRANVTEVEASLGSTKENLSLKEREIMSLRRQSDSSNEELMEVSRAREVALRENRRLQDDLSSMMKENQSVNQELQDALNEREQLKNQVQDYLLEMKRIEELLSSKEQERSDLLEQYRHLSLEAERFETQANQLESEGSNLRLELMTLDSENHHLKERVQGLEREIQEHRHIEEQYEAQVSNQMKTIAHLEDALQHGDEEKHGLMQDLAASRDLSAQLEGTNESMQRQMTAKILEQETLANRLEDLKHETDMLRNQVTSEHALVKNLEGVLASNREKEFQTQLALQEKDAEIHLLKDRLALSDSKLDSQMREIATMRARVVELESEADRLRRQLTNEKFERERTVQELRKHGLTPPGEAMSSRSKIRSSSPDRRSPYAGRSLLQLVDDMDAPAASNTL